ncbi:MAG: HEAT repeat domain-containing protein [Desulfuromonadaceae bacterium]
MKSFSKIFFLAFVFLALNAVASAEDDLICQLDRLLADEESASPKQFEEIRAEIEKNPDQALASLVARVNSGAMSEKNLAPYIWAMGLTKSPAAVREIIRITDSTGSKDLLQHSIQALAAIGSDQAGGYLLEKAQTSQDPMLRFDIFNALAGMRYEQAIPYTTPILEQDPDQYYSSESIP